MRSRQQPPARYAHATASDALKRLVSQSESVYLYGQHGHGKTWALWGLVRSCRSSVRYISHCPDITAARYDYEECSEWMRFSGLLIIDGICDATEASHWDRMALYAIADHRTNHCLRTVYAGNLSPDALAEQLGAPTAARMTCNSVEVAGVNRRLAE